MSSISGLGGFDATPRFAPAPAATSAAPAGWFEGVNAASGPGVLRAEVEHDARGLGVAAHAERVLAHLLADVSALPR